MVYWTILIDKYTYIYSAQKFNVVTTSQLVTSKQFELKTLAVDKI